MTDKKDKKNNKENGPDKLNEHIDPEISENQDNLKNTMNEVNNDHFTQKSDSGVSYMIVANGVPVNVNDLNDSQKLELEKVLSSITVIKDCIQAIMANDIFTASELIRRLAEANSVSSLEVIFSFARENANMLSFGMAMMINGSIDLLSGTRVRNEAIALLESGGLSL